MINKQVDLELLLGAANALMFNNIREAHKTAKIIQRAMHELNLHAEAKELHKILSTTSKILRHHKYPAESSLEYEHKRYVYLSSFSQTLHETFISCAEDLKKDRHIKKAISGKLQDEIARRSIVTPHLATFYMSLNN